MDDYAKKLRTSGWSKELTRRIILNGIKGYEGKQRRCKTQDRELHRSSKDSQGARAKKNFLGRATGSGAATRKLRSIKKRGGDRATGPGS